MAMKSIFTDLEPFKLTGVSLTDRRLGQGSYATVQELDYLGLKCAGKKIHEVLLTDKSITYSVRRFSEECQLLSRIRHPNIVQFLGVYFEEGSKIPLLVMEFLPTTLSTCIEEKGVLPRECSYSILYDVALGLVYLHKQAPPIVHRDLSASNVLLTSNMVAKISDLGVAKILNLTPLQISTLTQTPGTPAYMPPEVMVANPKYGTSVDIFSYGILIMHVFSGRWPEPETEQVRTEGDQLIPVTEAERRKTYLEAIGEDHPMMNLIHRCINNDFQRRPRAEEIAGEEQFSEVRVQSDKSFQDQLEQLKRVIADKEQMAKKDAELAKLHAKTESQRLYIEQKEKLICDLRQEVQATDSIDEEVERLGQALSDFAEGQCDEMDNLLEDTIKYGEIADSHFEALSGAVAQKLSRVPSQSRKQAGVVRDVFESRINTSNRQEQHKDETTWRYNYCTALVFIAILLFSVFTASLLYKYTEKGTAAINHLKQQHDKILTMNISWEVRADLPSELSRSQSTVINGIVYVGGGVGGDAVDESVKYLVYSYDPSLDEWTTLPTLPVRYSSLGQIDGSLVAIGGIDKTTNRETNDVYKYDIDSCAWKKSIHSIPTTRYSSGILSFQSSLVAVGGSRTSHDAVEIFNINTYDWQKTNNDPVPVKCYGLSTTVIGNTGYVIGGFIDLGHKNLIKRKQALYASLDDLLDRDSVKSPWKDLPNTPNYHSAAAVLDGNLLAIGGEERDTGGADKKEVYVYSPYNHLWFHVCDLPAPRALTTVAVLSSTEILVIGGWSNHRLKSVLKGTLTVRDSSWYDILF